MQKFEFASSSSDKTYTAVVGDDGRLGCNCTGWTIKRGDKPRECKHTKAVVTENKLTVERRGEYLYVTNGTATKAPAPAPQATAANGYVGPMLAGQMPDGKTIADFSSATHSMELKYDGIRLLVINADTVVGWSRPGADKPAIARDLPPHIAKGFGKLPRATYDGELTFPGGKSYDVSNLANQDKLEFVMFDITELLGNPTVNEPQGRRRLYLEEIARHGLPKGIVLAESFDPSKAVLDKIWKAGGEGVILKRKAAKYQSRRSSDWIKLKRTFPALMEVVGYEKGENGPYSKVLLRDAFCESSCKTKNNEWLRALAAAPHKYIGRYLWVTHYGKTEDKYRGPIIWDRWSDE